MQRQMLAIFMLLLLFQTIPLEAQPAATTNGEPVALTDVALYLMSPKWSPDGEKIAMTEANYVGIWVLEPATNDYLQVTDEVGAGFGFQWSNDSRRILCRVSKFEKGRRYNAVKLFDLQTGQVQQLTEYRTLMTGLPQWAENDAGVYLHSNKGLEIFEVKGEGVVSAKPKLRQRKVLYVDDNALYHFENQLKKRIVKKLDGIYLNTTLSPDGGKLAFELYAGNMYVLDLETNELTDLGEGNHPEWAPDSKRLVYMIVRDDGHDITESDIYAINIDGSGKTNLTQNREQIQMHPSWSPDGNKIAFDEYRTGVIYILELAP
ncbi:MAG: hypothetical protein SCK70_00370 [bacterium]|nr:hypothetical protein [bacterium]